MMKNRFNECKTKNTKDKKLQTYNKTDSITKLIRHSTKIIKPKKTKK